MRAGPAAQSMRAEEVVSCTGDSTVAGAVPWGSTGDMASCQGRRDPFAIAFMAFRETTMFLWSDSLSAAYAGQAGTSTHYSPCIRPQHATWLRSLEDLPNYTYCMQEHTIRVVRTLIFAIISNSSILLLCSCVHVRTTLANRIQYRSVTCG